MASSHDEYDRELGMKTFARTNNLDTLERVQRESGIWRAQAYPDTVADSLAQLAGVTEEIGELAHAILKHKQGIRGYDIEKTRREAGDAIADAIIYLCAVADTLSLSVADELSKAWAHVKSRNLVQNSDAGQAPVGCVTCVTIPGQACEHIPGNDRGLKPGDEHYQEENDPICPEHGNTCTGDAFHTGALVLDNDANYHAKLKNTPIDYGTNFVDNPAVAPGHGMVLPQNEDWLNTDAATNVPCPVPGHHHTVRHIPADRIVEDDNAFAGEVGGHLPVIHDEVRNALDSRASEPYRFDDRDPADFEVDNSDERWSLQEAGDE